MNDTEPEFIKSMTVSIKVLSNLLALDVRRIQQLENMGIVVKKGRGKYLPFPSIPNYIAFLRSGGNLDGPKSDPAQPVTRDTITQKDLNYETFLLKKADREIKEMELAEIRGELIRLATVRKWVMAMILSAKKRFRALPAKLAIPLTSMDDPEAIAELLLQEIDDGLREVSDDAPTR